MSELSAPGPTVPPPAATPAGKASSGRGGPTWPTWAKALTAVGAAAVLVAGVNEWTGWTWLARPAERWLSERLAHPVSLTQGQPGDFRVRLLGGIRLDAAAVTIGAPDWAGSAPVFHAESLALALNWRDLIGWRPGEVMPLQRLQAHALELNLLRSADGRTNWAMGDATPANANAPVRLPVQVASLSLDRGTLRWTDEPSQLDLQALVTPRELDRPGADPDDALARLGLGAELSGHFRGQPLSGALRTGAVKAWAEGERGLPVTLDLKAGAAALHFAGMLQPGTQGSSVIGQYDLRGPSLAAIGRALGITLPTTAAFRMQGDLQHAGSIWHTVVRQADIGRSRLAGDFRYDTSRAGPPLLAGRLRGPLLRLQDLGPAIGAPVAGEAAAKAPPSGKVLPDRAFDLPSLRAMDADVLVAIEQLDFGSTELQRAAPVRGHLTLDAGVLTLDELQLGVARGTVAGLVRLDGRAASARWHTRLTVRDMRLEQWVKALQRPGQPPYAGGRLTGQLALDGVGRSTAELLASADGRLGLRWTEGQVSHLVVEAAGLDVAQALGVLVRGDNGLAVQCGLADLRIKDGRVTPDTLVVDTTDSRLNGEGQLSLASERLDLRLKVQPKDFSPLAVRTPVHVAGTLSQPSVSLEPAPLLGRVALAGAIATVNPLAALLAFIDPGRDVPDLDCQALGTAGRPAAPAAKR